MRKQIAFASLTEAEIDQIADWLRRETYDAVRERVRKPRSEGGFGLHISRSPLERLHDKTNKVAKINAHLDTGEKLTVAKFDAIIAGDSGPCGEHSGKVHHAILEATYDLATSGENTPSQLLSLQRLADFPARAEIREQRLELDLQKHALRTEMAEHRKHIANEYLDLAKRRVDLAQKAIPFPELISPGGASSASPTSSNSRSRGNEAQTFNAPGTPHPTSSLPVSSSPVIPPDTSDPSLGVPPSGGSSSMKNKMCSPQFTQPTSLNGQQHSGGGPGRPIQNAQWNSSPHDLPIAL